VSIGAIRCSNWYGASAWRLIIQRRLSALTVLWNLPCACGSHAFAALARVGEMDVAIGGGANCFGSCWCAAAVEH